MAEGEHLSEQTRHLWLADKSKPYEGTEKNPQGRLFAPTGSYTGDPMKLHPANWLKQSDTPAHSDTISWHGSEESSLPRSDEYEHRQHEEGHGIGPDWGTGDADDDEYYEPDDFSTDSKDRPMGEYGSVVGMHFGSPEAAAERSPRPFLHPARLPESTMAPPPRGSFSTPKAGGGIVGGNYKSDNVIYNEETGDLTKDTRWTDSAANYAEKGTDLVESGKTLAYRNDVEAKGSTSFRTLPETARTWSEDVMSAKDPSSGHLASKYGWADDTSFRNKPHPALVHLAEKGFDPVVLPNETPRTLDSRTASYQMTLPLAPADSPYPTGGERRGLDFNKASAARQEAFDAGRTWTMRKPTS